MTAFSVISIDDHDLFRSGIQLLVESSFPDSAFASFASLGQALELQATAPNVVLLDLHLNGVDGHEAIPLLKLRWPACAIIVVTSELDRAEIDRARAKGSDAVVLKSEPPKQFISAIRAFAPTAGDAPSALQSSALSRRQLEVLRYLREGYSNKAIARRMQISEFTVRGHVQQILKLMDVSSRSQAVFKAQKSRLI